MRRLISLSLISFLLGQVAIAQGGSNWQEKPALHLSGFIDIFYAYDLNRPQGTQRQPFLFNHNRHNEFNLNLGLLTFGLEHPKYRANLALQTGTYANDNLAAEPGLLKNIFEANIGASLNEENTLWVDVGILPSHIGFESALSTENPTLTRSILAENSPYFLTGTKLSFSPNSTWEVAALVVNGWQLIQRLEGNSLPSVGTQVHYSPSDRVTLNWSTFIGTDDPDTTRRMRYFSNLYGQFRLAENIHLTTGFDIGAQQSVMGSSDYDLWFSLISIAQYTLNEKWKTAVRAEYYQDETGIMIPTGTPNGFQTIGISLNFDYAPTPNMACRIEGRWLNSRDDIFEARTAMSNTNMVVAASIAIKFAEKLSR